MIEERGERRPDANVRPTIYKFSHALAAGEIQRLDVGEVRTLWLRRSDPTCFIQFGDDGQEIPMPTNALGALGTFIRLPGPTRRIYVRNGDAVAHGIEFYASASEDFLVASAQG